MYLKLKNNDSSISFKDATNTNSRITVQVADYRPLQLNRTQTALLACELNRWLATEEDRRRVVNVAGRKYRVCNPDAPEQERAIEIATLGSKEWERLRAIWPTAILPLADLIKNPYND